MVYRLKVNDLGVGGVEDSGFGVQGLRVQGWGAATSVQYVLHCTKFINNPWHAEPGPDFPKPSKILSP